MPTFASMRLRVRAIGLAAGLAAPLHACDPSDADHDIGEPPAAAPAERRIVEYDIAEDMSRFAFDSSHVFDNGMPAYGNAFVTQGYIYSAGHLDEHPGTLADGRPADPDEVLGEWTCRGVFVGDGIATEKGPMVITTQTLALYDEPGWEPGKASGFANIISDGYEIVEVGTPVARAITGGTGEFMAGFGQVQQVLLGFNQSLGVNLRQTIEVYTPVADGVAQSQ